MQIRIDDKDLKELNKTLEKLIKDSPKEVDQLLQDTTSHIQGQARQLAPVDTDWLRKNIVKGKDANGYYVNSNAEYSLWVEYGNRWWGGVSFFRPSIEKGIEYMEQEINKRFNY